ncbi:MAG TPA: ATP-grasp domain-containing protein [Candidatus Acidoferrales bacterium]|nr:ATP-grasp domain-containing protein [Candidatus Acidoferrales bacterium]
MGEERRRVLILAGKLGYQTRGFAEAAERLGAETIFATDRCHQLDDPWGDHAIAVRFERAQEAARQIAADLKDGVPGAVIALGDRATPAGAYAARALGVKGNPPDAVEACRNKLRQRQVLAEAGLQVPDFFSFGVGDDSSRVLPRVKFPAVVKPLTLAASQGVVRVNDKEEFERAVGRVRALLGSPEIQAQRDAATGRLLVESYLPGNECAVEGLLNAGRLRVLAIFDKPDPLEGPYFEETIYVTPSRLSAAMQGAIADCLARATRALRLTTGPVHAEFRVNERGPWVLEIAPRPIGGLCSRALRFGPSGAALEELLLRNALGLPGADWEREEGASGVMMIPVPRSGIFEGVEGMDEAERVANVTEIRITARLKDYVEAWPEGSSYLGFIFARANAPGEVEMALREAHAKLRFRFSPRMIVQHPATAGWFARDDGSEKGWIREGQDDGRNGEAGRAKRKD